MRPFRHANCLVAFALAAIPLSGMAAEIQGTVSAPAGPRKPPPRYVVRGAASEPIGQSSNQVAIALESLDARVPVTVPDTPLVMAQQNTAFVPNLLVVPVGGQVTFPNHDAFFHNVFSYSPPRSFDLGRFPKGQTRTIRFQDAGIVRIFCEIHASMYGTIVVVNSNVYRVIKAGDPFTFGDLPAGRYRLLAVDATGRRSIQELALADGEAQHVALTLE